MNIKMTDTQKVEILKKWEEKKVKLTINQEIIQKKINYFEDQVSKASLEPLKKSKQKKLDDLIEELNILTSSFEKDKKDFYDFERKFPELFVEDEDSCQEYNQNVLLQNGKLEGLQKEYYPNGKLKRQTNYKNGKLEGYHKVYYENGKLESEYPYKNDKLEGVVKDYSKNGKLEREHAYIGGQLEEEYNQKLSFRISNNFTN